jgi:hypothetical protein
MAETTKAVGPDVKRSSGQTPREVYRARQERTAQRRAEGRAPRSEDATTIDEALEAEREAGRREGATKTTAPATRTPRAFNVTAVANTGPAPSVTAPMIVDVMIISADELANEHRLPVPSRLLYAFLIFGGLSLAKNTSAAKAAAVFGWGIVVATFYAGANPAGPRALVAAGKFLSGKPAKPAATTRAARTSSGAEAGNLSSVA